MLSQNITHEIDVFAEEIRRQNPLFTRARDGSLGPNEVRRYLASVKHLIQHTPIHLALARDQALERGWHQLASYYQQKWDEEQGHDQWAEADLRELSATRDSQADVSPAILRLIEQIEEIIKNDPLHYIAYTFFAEYFTVLCGREWMDLLNKNCGIPTQALSVVGNHAELDREHVRDAIIELNTLAPEPTDPAPFLQALRSTMACVREFYSEVGGQA